MARVGLFVVVSAVVFLAARCGDSIAYETAAETVTGTVHPSEQIHGQIVIEIDAADIGPFDSLTAALTVSPSPTTAVLGELWEEGTSPPGLEIVSIEDIFTPRVVYPLEEVVLDLGGCPDAGLCSFRREMTVGNLGTNAEEWMVTVTLERSAPEDRLIEIPSLQVTVEDEKRDRGLWATTGAVPINGDAGEPVAFAVTVTTSITDPALFDVLITEPRHRLITRSVEAVTGPTDLQWSPPDYEPSLAPLSSQAQCGGAGCRIDAVVIFRPRHREDWWIPVVVPIGDAMGSVIADNEVTIDVRPVGVARFGGDIGSVESGSFSLEIDAPPTTREAMIWWQVKPANLVLTVPVGDISTADGDELGHYRWFELDCGDRCRSDLTLSWQKPANRWNEPVVGELVYAGFVIAGTGHGVATETPPRVSVTENP